MAKDLRKLRIKTVSGSRKTVRGISNKKGYRVGNFFLATKKDALEMRKHLIEKELKNRKKK